MLTLIRRHILQHSTGNVQFIELILALCQLVSYAAHRLKMDFTVRTLLLTKSQTSLHGLISAFVICLFESIIS